jgi:hypothetical protein
VLASDATAVEKDGRQRLAAGEVCNGAAIPWVLFRGTARAGGEAILCQARAAERHNVRASPNTRPMPPEVFPNRIHKCASIMLTKW